MKKTIVPLIAILTILSLSALVLAQSQTAPPTTGTPPTTAAPPTAATPAETAKPSKSKQAAKTAGVRHMAGEVVSMNADTKSITVKHTGKRKAKEQTFTVTGDVAAHLTDFKPGDSVRISYVDEAGKLVAQSVTRGKQAAKK